MSVWTAPITAGGGTKPTITVTPDARRPTSGRRSRSTRACRPRPALRRSTRRRTASGHDRRRPARSRPAPRRATTAGNELAIGMYVDSGFGDTLTAGVGIHAAVSNISERLGHGAADRGPGAGVAGATPNATVGHGREDGVADGARSCSRAAARRRRRRRPARPPACRPSAGDGNATVSWTRAQRRWQPDHELHGDAVRRLDRADADDRERASPSAHGDRQRPDQRHHLHVHGHAPPTRSAPGRRQSVVRA